jgi:diacylglycerol O-acyltransferase / wax synthase
MVEKRERPRSEPLTGEDLGFWWGDQPRQRTTMAMLLLLDRRPPTDRLRAAVWRAVEAVPRLRQRVVDAPLDLARPRWEDDPTFDLDFHVRRYAVSHDDGSPQHATSADLFHTLGPIYERPFDRSRPLWELIELDGPGEGSALFFRLHHGVADGVGGNAILAALTDAEAEAATPPAAHEQPPGGWEEESLPGRFAGAVGRRIREDLERGRALRRLAWHAVSHPSSWWTAARVARGLVSDLVDASDSPLREFGPARHLSGFAVPFEPLRKAKVALGGQMIDVMLTAVAGAVGSWHRANGHADADEVMTLVPINLRPRGEQGLRAGTGNRASGVMVRLPLREGDPIARFREIHARVCERKAQPLVEHLPALAEVLAVLPAPLFRYLSRASSQSVNLIVTNVPGIMQPRYVAGARITAGYPFAPLAPRCPVSIALYGYDQRLYIGIDADRTAMPDLPAFEELLRASFAEVIEAAARSRLS